MREFFFWGGGAH